MRNVVLATGGRDYTNHWFVWQVLDQIHLKTPITLLVEGGATGADWIANGWATSRGIPINRYLVSALEWKKFGKAAGPRRNARMLDVEKPDVVVAFPTGGPGTRDCMRQARERNIPVMVYRFGVGSYEL